MKFSIKYQLSPRTEGDRLTENVPIRLRVSFAGIRVDLRSGYVIDAEKWDNNNACVKKIVGETLVFSYSHILSNQIL